jgi:hypothetical protein
MRSARLRQAKRLGLVAASAVCLVLGTAAASQAAGPHGRAHPAPRDVCPNQVYNGYIKSGLSNYLDDYGGGSGTYVHTYQLTYSSNQTWCVEKASETRGGFFIHPNNNLGLCLDTHQYTDDYPVWVYTCNGTNPQRWCWNGHGYIVTWAHSNVALKDQGRYHVVDVVTSGATQWYTNGATFSDNC